MAYTPPRKSFNKYGRIHPLSDRIQSPARFRADRLASAKRALT
jgi:hypothetical protein